MRTLYIDCGMGAAGDMLSAALYELHPDKEGFISRLNSIGIPGVTVSAEKSVKCGISGTHFHVSVNGVEEDEHLHDHHNAHSHGHDQNHEHSHHHHHEHSSMHGIAHIIEHLDIPEKVRSDVKAVYGLIAAAESKVHGVEMEHIHFHEVGSMDAVADITAVCLLIHELGIEEVLSSPVHVGSGTVKCAHGILPVPAPATAEILKGVPIYSGNIKTELCTPTGAALLRHFVRSFGDMPPMAVSAIGYGMGKKDFERANCLRVLLGETENRGDTVAELSCNVDDMNAEEIGFAMERLLEAGALDVFTTPIGMKKSRPGMMISLICPVEDRERFAAMMLKYTSSIGIRENTCRRYVLRREVEKRETAYGAVRVKRSSGYGVEREKYEYEDLAAIAREQGLSLRELRDLLNNIST